MYDVIVVGARVAGSSTALAFAQAGYRVLLVDRAHFPSDTLSTHYIHQPGIALLAKWGALDAVKATGCPPLERTIYQVEDVRLDGCSEAVEGQKAAYAPRRHLLDKVLIDKAIEAGVEFREGYSVSGAVFDGDRVVGIKSKASEERAHLVVGADGMRSVFAKAVGAEYTVSDPLLSCIYYTYWQGLKTDFELYERPGRWVGAVPTNDNATMIAAYYPQADYDRVRGDALTHYLENIKHTAPELYEKVIQGEQAEKLKGTGDQQNFFRQPNGPGWALVGDAAHHKDSITARGISDAFLQSNLLTELVGDGLTDRPRLDAALEAYGKQHQDALFEGYRNTLFVARLEVAPERLAMLRAVQTSPNLTAKYFAAAAGGLSVEELYDDELLDLLAV